MGVQIVDDHKDVGDRVDPMWLGDDRKGGDHDIKKEVEVNMGEPHELDLEHLHDMTDHSDKGSYQLANLVKHWEYKQANAVRLLREELDCLSKQREKVELKRLKILEQHRFEEERVGTDRYRVSVMEKLYDSCEVVPENIHDSPVESRLEIEAEYDTVVYWKQRAMISEEMLEESRQREQTLLEKFDESLKNLENQSTPVEELSHMLKRADNFIHFILQNAPIVLGHVDNELRYRFIYNHFPSFKEEDIIGKTEMEIFSGAGVKESLDFKREVLVRGLPGKREITFETELCGSKTFLMYAEPVFNKAEEAIGVNYIGMDITDQVRKREKMAKLREEVAVQRVMETELNKTMHIAEETMRAKQMLATMSHEIRSPLAGVVGLAEVLANTRLDKKQREWVRHMLSSGEWVLQLINDILDLSKVESGVMKFEATKFRPKEVVRHVLQTAAVSMKKMLTLEGFIAEEVPKEIIGDVLRIRQILTNLVSNAIKFTHEGKVGIKLAVVPAPYSGEADCEFEETHSGFEGGGNFGEPYCSSPHEIHPSLDDTRTPNDGEPLAKDEERPPTTTVWIRCDVYDTGIGIPEHALPKLFNRYTQASTDHARKYGGTGLGLSICKELVELMGGHMTVSSEENCGSTFTFVLPYRVSQECDGHFNDHSDAPDEITDASDYPDENSDASDDHNAGYFQFQPPTLNLMSEIYNPAFDSSATSSHVLEFEPAPPETSPRHSGDDDDSNDQRIGNERSDGEIQSSLDGDQPTLQGEPSFRSTTSSSPQENGASKILLAEDDQVNMMVTTTMIKQLGHSIDAVKNGIEAVRAVQNHTYELVLMDVNMPEMDGLQATKIIRSYEKTGNWNAAVKAGIDPPLNFHDSSKRIPIIVMTATALSEITDEYYLNGVDLVVSKPVGREKLQELLQRYLP